MKKKNENINGRNSKNDTRIEGAGTNESTDSKVPESEQPNDSALGEQATEGGVQNSEEKGGDTKNNDLAPTVDADKIPPVEVNEPEVTLKTIGFKATIPVVQYGNIMPEIVLETKDIEKGTKIGMDYIEGLFAKYSEKGALKVSEISTAVSTTIKLKSFNEEGVEVDFDPIAHTYTYNGVRLQGATTFIKQYYKEFDSKMIAEASAKAWGVDAGAVERLWNSNGDTAGEFGTLLHKLLEHYEENKELGETIFKNKLTSKSPIEENYAMPKHPILKQIIKGFLEVDGTTGKLYREVLITDVKRGYCGQADRLIVTGDKTAIIEDYKINVDSEKEDKNNKAKAPWDILPANKISKYQLQMSIYANMLQATGWNVTGLKVYVLEDKWLPFDLPVLNVINNANTN